MDADERGCSGPRLCRNGQPQQQPTVLICVSVTLSSFVVFLWLFVLSNPPIRKLVADVGVKEFAVRIGGHQTGKDRESHTEVLVNPPAVELDLQQARPWIVTNRGQIR
jgi:hypothetical protein